MSADVKAVSALESCSEADIDAVGVPIEKAIVQYPMFERRKNEATRARLCFVRPSEVFRIAQQEPAGLNCTIRHTNRTSALRDSCVPVM